MTRFDHDVYLATSMTATFAAAGMIGAGIDVVMVGGIETMSRPPIGLSPATSDRLRELVR
jgi:acetyl-CoA C-acetyltransferase